MRRAVAVALASAALLAAVAAGAGAAERPRGDTRVLALVPPPGFPAMAYAAPNGRIYEGTYDNPSGDAVASRVFEYQGDGTLVRSWTISGQDLSGPHGIQVGTFDGAGRLILLDKSPPRVLRLNRVTGEQTTIAGFPAGAVPNYAAWGPDRALYVTDYHGGTVWRVPPGGGEPAPWLKDPLLDGAEFGTTGIVLSADRSSFLVANQSEAGSFAGNPATGRILKVPIAAGGAPGPVAQLWESSPLDGPDGFAVARSGTIYIANLLTNQIAVVGPDGAERERFSSPLFDNPSSVRFLGTRLIVANQSYVNGDRAHQAILDVESGEAGQPEFIPAQAQKAKPKPKKKKKKKRKKKKRRS
jgi:sugar lactone lactonase YvrE